MFPLCFGNSHEGDVNCLVSIPFVMTAPGYSTEAKKKLRFPYVSGNSHEGDVHELVPIPFVMTAPQKRLCFAYVLATSMKAM